jgi:hypothetical protein
MHSSRYLSRSTVALIAVTGTLAAFPAVAAAEPAPISTYSPAQDLRSPDTRDAATGWTGQTPDAIHPGVSLKPELVEIPSRVPAPVTVSGFDWQDAALGALAAVGLILIAAAAVLTFRRRTGRDGALSA